MKTQAACVLLLMHSHQDARRIKEKEEEEEEGHLLTIEMTFVVVSLVVDATHRPVDVLARATRWWSATLSLVGQFHLPVRNATLRHVQYSHVRAESRRGVSDIAK